MEDESEGPKTEQELSGQLKLMLGSHLERLEGKRELNPQGIDRLKKALKRNDKPNRGS